jgi:site-specific DNA-methyltransferase (adenine-specific)
MINLLQGDCLEMMKEIPDGSVDMVLTDPPYRVMFGGNKSPGRPTGILSKNDGKIFKHNDIEFSDYLPELYRVMADRSHLYLMVNFLNLETAMKCVREAGFKIHNLLIWNKNNATPNRWYMKNVEYVIFARKGKAKTIQNPGSKTSHAFDNVKPGRLHPTQKPVELMQHYIENSSTIGDIVFDPFMGSGSTGVAAKNLDRSFIGIEMDDEYFKIAKERIENTNPLENFLT